MRWYGEFVFVIQYRLCKPRCRFPAGIWCLSWHASIVVLFHPFQQFCKISTLVHGIKVRVRSVVSEDPVGCDGRNIALAHYDLAEIIDAVV